MSDYGRFCPVSLATEVIADRWTPMILRELILGNTRFNDIARGLPGISRSLLTKRLRHLERKGVVVLYPSRAGRGHEYHLTAAGRDLEGIVMALGRWAVEWLYDDLDPDDIDPVTLTWWMHRRIDPSALPPGRVVLEFDYVSPVRQVIWMVLDHGEPSVCMHHPGFESNVVVTASTPALARVFQGADSWRRAVSSDAIRVAGPPALVKAIPHWFLWSPFADVTADRGVRWGHQHTAGLP